MIDYLLRNSAASQPRRNGPLHDRIQKALKEKCDFVIKRLFGGCRDVRFPEGEEWSKKNLIGAERPVSQRESADGRQELTNCVASLECHRAHDQKTRIALTGDRISLMKTPAASTHPARHASDGSIDDGKQSSRGSSNLGGLCILCVGGRAALYPAYRRLVETSGGNFLVYRGDPRDKISYLLTLLIRADAIICPIDCVNHGVYFAVKRYCKRFGKPCALLKRSCLPTFSKGVAMLAATTV